MSNIDSSLKEIQLYLDKNGKSPFQSWLNKVVDKTSKAKILQRIDRIKLGNFGDCRSVGDGVYEFRIHYGPGFRVYFGIINSKLVLLLCGGDKSTQKSDIASAKLFWKEFKEDEN